jgi:hypothetical protein
MIFYKINEIRSLILEKKFNLSVLNLNEETLETNELQQVLAGSEGSCVECECFGDYTLSYKADVGNDQHENCTCGSIFTIFGLAIS